MDVKVFLWNNLVGILRYNENEGKSSFQYDLEFIKKGVEISPIIMPLSTATYRFDDRIETNFGLPPLLRDSLPDVYGNKLINIYLKSLGRNENSLTPAERLCYQGKRGMGALEYIPDTSGLTANEKIDIEELTKTAAEILSSKEKFKTKDIDELISVSTSAGGARAKAIVQYNAKTGEFRSGQVDCQEGFEYFIIKFDGMEKSAPFTRLEYAYYLMAKEAGIKMMDSSLVHIGGKHHFLTKRFDRHIANGKVEKLHVQTLASLMGLDYNSPREIGYEDVARMMLRNNMKNDLPELYRRMVFNVLAYNNDDHVKNISFIMNKAGEWSLSPAYDLTFSCNENSPWIKAHQMSINGKGSNITKEDLLEASGAFLKRKADAEKIINEVKFAISQFKKFAKKAKLQEEEISEVLSFLD